MIPPYHAPRTAIIFVLAFMATLRTPCAEAGASADVSYIVEVVDPAAHLLRVSLSVSGVSVPNLSLALSQDIVIRAVRASVASHPASMAREGDHFKLATTTPGDVNISYELSMNQWKDARGHGPLGYLCDGYMFTAMSWSFLVPDNAHCSFSPTIQVAHGMAGRHPVARIGQGLRANRHRSVPPGHLRGRQLRGARADDRRHCRARGRGSSP